MNFSRLLASDARVLVETDEGRPFERYAVMLQVRAGEGWTTILLFDNAHGQHDLHRYTGSEKQPAVRFLEGTPQEVVPAAVRHLVDRWEAIVRTWKAHSDE